jgi:DNA repair protein RadD
MVGRALRPGKPLAYVLDHAGNVHRHGLPSTRRCWSLHGKQKPDGAADGLLRCPHCGAINEPGADVCAHCGGELRQKREPRVEVAAPRLVEAVEIPLSDADLARMSYRAVLQWAADHTGRLLADRLQRIARAREYSDGWVWHCTGLRWDELWLQTVQWREQQQRETGR